MSYCPNIEHKHQWRFRGSRPVERVTQAHGLFPAVKAKRIFFRSCVICDEQSGRIIKCDLEQQFVHGRWVSAGAMSHDEVLMVMYEDWGGFGGVLALKNKF